MNTSRDLFSSLRMRRAVNYAIDRRALARAGAGGGGSETPTDQYLPPGMPGFRDARIYPLRPNIDKARQLAGPGSRTAVLYAGDDPADLQQAADRQGKPEGDRGRCSDQDSLPRGLLPEGLGARASPTTSHCLVVRRLRRPRHLPRLLRSATRPANPNQSTHDSYFDEPRYTRRLAAAERLSPPERYVAYGRLESDLARNAAPWAAIGNPVAQDFFSERIGCQVFHPLYGIDLTALCIRR